MKTITEKGQKGFLLWVKANQPILYNEFVKRRHQGVSGMGDTTLSLAADPISMTPNTPASPAWVQNITGALTGAAQIYLTTQQLAQQRKVLDIQLARAQQGLAPLNIDPMSYGLAPTVGIGLSPQLKQLIIWGGGALLAVLLLPKLIGRR